MKKIYKYLGIFVIVVVFVAWYITQMRLDVIKENTLLYDPYFRYINYYYDEEIVLQFESEEEEELLTAILNLDWERKLLLDPSWYLNEHREGESLPTLKFFTCVNMKVFFATKCLL